MTALNGRKPNPVASKSPVIHQLFAHVDATSTRSKVWKRAGYAGSHANRIARGTISPSFDAFINICEAAGLEVKLVPKEPPS